MNKNLQDLDNNFRNAYERFEAEPSASVWNKINKALEAESRHKKSKRIICWKVATVLVPGLLATFGYFQQTPISLETWNQKLAHSASNIRQSSIVNILSIKTDEASGMAADDNDFSKLKTDEVYRNGYAHKVQTADARLSGQAKIEAFTTIREKRFSGGQCKNLLAVVSPVKPDDFAVSGKIDLVKPIMCDTESGLANARAISMPGGALRNHKWSVAAFVSNDWANYRLKNSGAHTSNTGEIGSRERHEASFSTGAEIERKFEKKFSLKSGIIYSNTAIAITPQQMHATAMADGSVAYKFITSSGYGYVLPNGASPSVGDSIQSSEAQHSLGVVGVPLLIGYRVTNKRFTLTPAVGLIANVVTEAKVKTELKGSNSAEMVTINRLKGIRNCYASLMGEVNLQIRLKENLGLTIQPAFKYAITPITRGNETRTYPYSLNLGAAITYNF